MQALNADMAYAYICRCCFSDAPQAYFGYFVRFSLIIGEFGCRRYNKFTPLQADITIYFIKFLAFRIRRLYKISMALADWVPCWLPRPRKATQRFSDSIRDIEIFYCLIFIDEVAFVRHSSLPPSSSCLYQLITGNTKAFSPPPSRAYLALSPIINKQFRHSLAYISFLVMMP